MRPNPVRTNLPMVETAAQAQQIASWCRYRPQGAGVAFGTPRNDYACGDLGQKLREANEHTLVFALIETAAGIADAKASRGDRYRLARPFFLPVGFDEAWLGDEKKSETLWLRSSFGHYVWIGLHFCYSLKREDFRMVDYQTIAELVNQISVDTWDVLRQITQRRPAMMLSELIDCKTRASQQPERQEPRSPTNEPINPG